MRDACCSSRRRSISACCLDRAEVHGLQSVGGRLCFNAGLRSTSHSAHGAWSLNRSPSFCSDNPNHPRPLPEYAPAARIQPTAVPVPLPPCSRKCAHSTRPDARSSAGASVRGASLLRHTCEIAPRSSYCKYAQGVEAVPNGQHCRPDQCFGSSCVCAVAARNACRERRRDQFRHTRAFMQPQQCRIDSATESSALLLPRAAPLPPPVALVALHSCRPSIARCPRPTVSLAGRLRGIFFAMDKLRMIAIADS